MLAQETRHLAQLLRADIIGISPAQDGPGYTAQDLLPQAQSVVVLGKRVLSGSLSQGHGRSVAYILTYLNIKLNEIAYEVARLIEDKGYKATPVFFPTLMLTPLKSQEFPKEFSYRHAGVAAGLGEIGLNQLLITPRYGSRVRLAAVITTAPLKADNPLKDKLCYPEQCHYRCLQACPVGALSPAGELDREKCVSHIWKYLHILGYAQCAACMAACPVGQAGTTKIPAPEIQQGKE